MLIDWLNSYDKSKSPDWSQAQLVNWYLQSNKRGSMPLAAYPCPGTLLLSSNVGSVWRGLYSYNNMAYGVLDNKFYSISSSGVLTQLGTLLSSTGRVRFANITDQIVFIDDAHGYHYQVSTNTYAQIIDVDFPSAPRSISAQDEYFMISQLNSPIVIYSDVSDGTSYNALNILQKTGIAQDVTAVKSIYPYVWFIGPSSAEPYFNSGLPFERDNTGVIKIGVPTEAVDTIAVSTTFWFALSQNMGGGWQVIQANQGQFTPVSNDIKEDLHQVTDLTGAFAYIYMQEDNEFYSLTIPAHGLTLQYNITTQSWNKRESYVSGQYTRHIVNCYCFCYGKQIVGDYQSGNLYFMDTDTYTENNVPIRRTLVTYPFYKEGKYITGSQLQVVFESAVGTDSDIEISFSKDFGHTFTTYPSREIGTIPGSRSILFNRLGSARAWQFKAQTTMTDKCVMLGAVGDFRVGSW